MLEKKKIQFFLCPFWSSLFQQFHRSLMILTLSEMFKHKTQTISWDGASVEAPFNQMDFFFYILSNTFPLNPAWHIWYLWKL